MSAAGAPRVASIMWLFTTKRQHSTVSERFLLCHFLFCHQHVFLTYPLLISTRLFAELAASLLQRPQGTDQIDSGGLRWLQIRKLAFPSTRTESSTRVFYVCFGRLVWFVSGEEIMCAKQAENLLTRVRERLLWDRNFGRSGHLQCSTVFLATVLY